MDAPNWMQTIALEVCKTFCDDPSLLLSFKVYYDVESAKIFEQLVDTIAKYALNMASTLEISHITLSQNMKGRCLDQLWQTEPPQIKDSYVVSLTAECLNGLVNAIYQLTTNYPLEPDKYKVVIPASSPMKDIEELGKQMASSSWHPLYTSLSALLTKTSDEGLIQLLLKSHQLCIHTCGLLHMSTPRDAFLTSLCKSCLPPPLALSQSNQIMSGLVQPVAEETASLNSLNPPKAELNPIPTNKNILAIKLLLNIVPHLSSVLENGWILVLETMEHWDRIMKTQMHSSDDSILSPPSSPIASSLHTSLSSTLLPAEPFIADALAMVFKNSNAFDNESVLFMLDALVRLATAEIATLVSNTPASSYMFPMYKLVDTAHANVHRVDVIWPLIMPFLIEAAVHKNTTIRNFATESLTTIIHNSLAHTISNPLSISQEATDPPEMADDTQLTDESTQPNTLESESTTESKSQELPEGTDSPQTEAHNNSTSQQSTNNTKPYPPQTLDGRTLSMQELHVDAMQVKMLEALTELSKNSYNDVKDKTLNAVDTLLQSSGQTLNSGWPLLLTILKRVAENNDKLFIPTAFKCVQLICTDFLSNFQPHHLALFISVIGEFGKQNTDINISLTAVGLLWNVADFLAHERDKDKASIYHMKDVASLPYLKEITMYETSGEPDPPYEVDTRPLLDRMWQCVFCVLRPLGTDKRPEVRNCALSTLFKTLTPPSHAHFLQLNSWLRVLQCLLFPLLDDVRNLAAAAADVKIDNELGGGVMMLVHHSRNTAQKQWDETKVLAMGGIVRVMKMFFDTLCALPTFITIWTRVVRYLETQATSSSKEVSHAAITNFQEIIFTHIALQSCPPEVRDVTWVALERLAVCLISYPEIATKSIATFVQILGDLYNKTRTFIVPHNLRRLIRMTHPLALYIDPNPPQTTGIAVGQPSALQASILSLLQTLPPVPDLVFPLVFSQLFLFVSHAIGYNFSPTFTDSTQLPNAAPSQLITSASPQLPSRTPHNEPANTHPNCGNKTQELLTYPLNNGSKIENSLVYPLAEKSLQVIVELFSRPDTSDMIRAAVYGDIAKVVGAAMMTKYSQYHAGLWKVAVDVFIALLAVGLPALCNDVSPSAGNSANANNESIHINKPIHGSNDQPHITNDQIHSKNNQTHSKNNQAHSTNNEPIHTTNTAPDHKESDPRELLVMTDIKRNIVWTELMDSIQAFLFHDRIPIPQPPEKRAEEEDYDVALVDAMSQTMVKFCSASPGVHLVHERVVEILSEGATLTNSGREKFALGCYKNMFALASTNTKPRPSQPTQAPKPPLTLAPPTQLPTQASEITELTPLTSSTPTSSTLSTTTLPSSIPTSLLVPEGNKNNNGKLTAMILPVLLSRCRDVLHRFVIDDRQSGLCPLPRYRLAEVIFLLRELLYLELPTTPDTPNNTSTSTSTSSSSSSTTTPIPTPTPNSYKNHTQSPTSLAHPQHMHLIELYPLFCECITSSERDLKDLLKEIFYLVGKEFLAVKHL
eukprot:Phypoly_transcript_00282.p1 GENE.Phypoly_transcript_00282~~Phypoly_transcript_00282.p1  ORF type:complete len:1756 (+),score=269.99 Phypoly_transcript_00282:745-5268(+)